jgi:hypothetical protein
MWVILGSKVDTRRVPGGRKVERACTACGETAMFYEREVSKSFRLYFVDLFNYETQRVMACGACGAHYATDELGAPTGDPQRGTVFGGVRDALRRAGNALTDATGTPREVRDAEAVEEPKQLAAPDEELPDPLAADDDELEAKFAALEKKLGAQRSTQKPTK